MHDRNIDDMDSDALPRDPDWDAVPAELAANHGRVVCIVAPDGRVVTGLLAVEPGVFGDARRARGDDAA